MNRYEQQLADYAKQVNDALRERLSFERCRQIVVVDAMRYSLLDAGKRIRAALTLEFGRLSNAPRETSMAFACSVEMVHAYSLIHDDLPCMDNDDFRRGKPSCHKAFGEANALLAGDGLLTLAFETAAGAPLCSDTQRVEAIKALSQAAGVLGMIGGQVIDLAWEGKDPDVDTLKELYRLKTGAMLRVSAAMGCIAGNANPQVRTAADRYAQDLGMAFQITDDVLDVAGNQEQLGKPIGSDAENHKTTFVTLFGVEGAKEQARLLVDQAKENISSIPQNGFLLWLADMILSRNY